MGDDLKRLSELKSAEVSLVNRGANRKGRFPFFKGEDEMLEEIMKAVLETETDGEAELEKFCKEAKVSDKGQSAAKGALRILNAFKDEMPKSLMNELAKVAGIEAPAAKQKEKEEYKYPEAKKQKEKEEEYPMKKVEKDALGDLPDGVREKIEPVFKAQAVELDNLRKKNEEFEKQLKVEKDNRELAGWLAKAKEGLSHFPGKSTEELGQFLKNLADLNPEMAEQQFEQMKAASEAIKKSHLLHEAGSSISVGSSQGSAWDKIQKMADGIVQKDATMTKEKAINLVMKQHPELYQEYLNEHPGQNSSTGVM